MKRLAMLLLLLAACDGGDATTPDAIDLGPAGDVSIETRASAVIVTQPVPLEPGQLIGGVEIVAIDRDGTTTRTTSVAGHATVTVHAGASVTAIYGRPDGDAMLTSYLDVRPGDQLVFGDEVSDQTPWMTSMQVTWPSAGSYYDVYGACIDASAQSTSAGLVHTQLCDPSTETVYLYAYTASGVQYGVIRDAPWIDGGTLTLDAWHPAPVVTVAAQGLPGDTKLTLTSNDIIDGRARHPQGEPQPITPSGGAASVMFPIAPTDQGALVNASVYHEVDGAVQSAVRRIDPATTSSVSFAYADLLPPVTEASYSFATHTVSFAADDAEADETQVLLDYNKPFDGNLAYSRSWRAIAPPGVHDVVMPDLPSDLDAYEPVATDVSLGGWVYSTDLDDANGWDAVRTGPAWPLSWDDPILIAPSRTSSLAITYGP